MDIHWYPGHMTRTRRRMEEDLKNVDLVVELIDARIPISSRNPDIDTLAGDKPRIVVLNRSDQADPAGNRAWAAYFRARGIGVLETDAKSGAGVNGFTAAAKAALREKIARWQEKGQVGRAIRAMIVGVPNVGKSTLINKLAGRKAAIAEDRPGVTRGKQWITVGTGLLLLDTPGILWPKFEDERTGLHLAYTGAVKDDILDTETLGRRLMQDLARAYPQALIDRYHIEPDPADDGWTLLEKGARRRGFLISGGEVDRERMARILLDEFRGGKLGRFTLEMPEEMGESHGTA